VADYSIKNCPDMKRISQVFQGFKSVDMLGSC
jgi:hypothetical protein